MTGEGEEDRRRTNRNKGDVFGKIWLGQRSACSPGARVTCRKEEKDRISSFSGPGE